MTPLEYYNKQCEKGVIFSDPAQLSALNSLNRVYYALIKEHKRRYGWQRLFLMPSLINGIYLWGGVGVGKTYLMDCLFHVLPFEQKTRMHFHQFMRRVHEDLTRHQGQSDPLHIIAKELAKKVLVICFDEFFVSDITDAMLLGRLLKALFAQGVCLIATSNISPDDLYKNGLQRVQFLPAISLIKKNLEIVHIPTSIDYRLRHLQEAGVFYTPLDLQADENMQKTFALLTEKEAVDSIPIIVNDRSIPVKKKSEKVIWFDFIDICCIPRCQNDYLAIAERYETVFISDIPMIPMDATDTICLFISLIDVLYDARVKLVMSAAESIPLLYSRGYQVLELTRTHSRLLEMQSMDYFLGGF